MAGGDRQVARALLPIAKLAELPEAALRDMLSLLLCFLLFFVAAAAVAFLGPAGRIMDSGIGRFNTACDFMEAANAYGEFEIAFQNSHAYSTSDKLALSGRLEPPSLHEFYSMQSSTSAQKVS